MSENYRSILNVLSTPLLLDTYGGSAVAYSLRKLSSTYSGSAIRVRRSSDNAEQDIGFVDGDLDTQSLLDFVGYNLLTYSEDFTIATPIWNKYQTTITADVETAPDGTLTGDKLVESAVNGYHYLDRTNYAITNGVDYNISIYLKQGERTLVRFASAISGTNTSCDIDLTNGTISNNGFANTPVVTSEANGWYRFSVTITSGTTSAAPLIRLFPYNASNQIIYTGDGTSGFYVWGAQLTQTSDVRNYTKTVATANAGNAYITTWYDQSGNANDATQATAANQPRIVNSGVIETTGSENAIKFDGSNDYMTRTAISALDSGNNYSYFTIVSNNLTANISTVFATSAVSVYRVDNLIDTRTTGGFYRNFLIQNTSLTAYYSDLSSANGSTNQRLLSGFVNGFNMSAFDNGNTGGTATYTGTYNNDLFDIAAFRYIPRYLNGYIQEIIIYPTDESSNRVGIETNINDYYSIY